MSNDISNRPRIVSILSFVLIAYGLYLFVKVSLNLITLQQDSSAGFLPVTTTLLLSNLINTGIIISAAISIYKQQRWGWWLTGIVLCKILIAGIFGLLQLFLMPINRNGQALYQLKPERLYPTAATLAVTLLLLPLLFTGSIRAYLNTEDISKAKSLSLFFGFAILLLLIQPTLLMIVGQYMNLNK